jgi:PAS domain-containing protein
MEQFFLDNSNKIYYLISVFTAVVTFVGFLSKYLRKIIIKIRERNARVEEIHNKVEKIFEEITPNHGSSIKDKINSLDKRMDKVDENLVLNNKLTEKIFYRQRWILDNQAAAVFESDVNGKCIWANVHYLKLVQRDMAFILGNGWKNIIHPDDRERVIINWDRCVEDGIDAEDTYRIIDIEGRVYRVFCSATKTEGNGYIGSIKVLDNE